MCPGSLWTTWVCFEPEPAWEGGGGGVPEIMTQSLRQSITPCHSPWRVIPPQPDNILHSGCMCPRVPALYMTISHAGAYTNVVFVLSVSSVLFLSIKGVVFPRHTPGRTCSGRAKYTVRTTVH